MSGAVADDLAYVIHTSGSTGTPKGVMVPHRGLVNRLAFAPAAGHLRPGDRFLQKASISFDVSLLELFLPLLAGGSIVLARPGGHQDPGYLARLMAAERVHQAIFPPSLLGLVLEEEAIAGCPCLHSVASSAEALALDLQERFYTRLSADLYNRYGPTEASIAASSWRCRRDQRQRNVPIGRPIARAQLYVLQRDLQPAAMGASGELHIGGVGLARGYHARPARTAEVFIPHPFDEPGAPQPGRRLYKTGDLARYRPDGAIEFLGRIDTQVKVRGFRVEMGEIEAVLAEHPAVQEVAVADRGDDTVRLVAYFAPRRDQPVAAGELRRLARGKLPEYMVPAVFMELEELPVTPSGKVDRRALPAPEHDRSRAEAEYAAPETPAEEALARIWAEALGLAEVGIHDDFFELGGDSILSIRIVSEAARAGLELTLRQLFENPTVARLATVAGVAPTIRAEQGPVTGSAPLAPIQSRFYEQQLPDPHHVNQAVLLAVSEPLDEAVLEDVARRLLEHHDALRLRFVREGNGWQQSFAPPGGEAPVARLDLSALDEAARRPALEAATAQIQTSLDLAAGPLVRLASFDLGAERSGRLLIVIHHLAVDGVSWRILVEDLENAYRQRAAGEEVELQPKTTSYRQWAERLLAWSGSDDLEPELAYWLSASRERAGRLPVDFPGAPGADTFASTRSLSVALAADETEALLREVPEAYRTRINDALLTALAQTFCRWTGRRALWMDLESHGREHPFGDLDVSRTVGWFTSIFPVRLEPGRALPPGEALKTVKEQLRGVPGGGLSYGLLRYLPARPEAAAKLRDLPQAEVSFNYLGQLDQALGSSSLFRRARESSGPERSARGARRYLIEINGWVSGGRLELQWSYGGNRHRRTTIERLAQDYLAALRALIADCRSPGAGGYTPSDFPKVALDQSKLDAILKKVGGGKKGIAV